MKNNNLNYDLIKHIFNFLPKYYVICYWCNKIMNKNNFSITQKNKIIPKCFNCTNDFKCLNKCKIILKIIKNKKKCINKIDINLTNLKNKIKFNNKTITKKKLNYQIKRLKKRKKKLHNEYKLFYKFFLNLKEKSILIILIDNKIHKNKKNLILFNKEVFNL